MANFTVVVSGFNHTFGVAQVKELKKTPIKRSPKRKVVFSAGYSVGQIALGLVVHPYQTMQSLVREKVFVWMSLVPTLALMLITLLWKLMVVPIVSIVFSCSEFLLIDCRWLVYVSNFITFYCIYWQILLFYLLMRFNFAFRSKL